MKLNGLMLMSYLASIVVREATYWPIVSDVYQEIHDFSSKRRYQSKAAM